MPVTFRSRLFRLFLLFALVPSIVLTVIGYYVAVDTPSSAQSPDSERSDLIQGYFITLLYDDIERVLIDYQANPPALQKALDFVVRVDSAGAPPSVILGDISPESIDRLREFAPRQSRGLLTLGDRFLQYVSIADSTSVRLVGGIVHDSSFAAVLEGARLESGTRSAEQELRSRYIVFLGILFLTVMLAAIVGAYILSSRVSGRLAEPVIALSRAAGRIAAGDFKQQVSISASDELGILVESFNRMTLQLEQTTARLAQSERVAAWRQVARRFAHELKNPLQPILVSLYRIEQQLDGTDQWAKVREPLQAAGEEVKHLTSLAERFSLLAKLPPPKLERVELKNLVESIFSLYAERLRPFKSQLDVPSESVFVVTDTAYVREAVHNLMQNAIDACREGDRIKLLLTRQEDHAMISVVDTGPGMDAATLASARLPYYTTKAKGDGLGLAIVEKSLAELDGQLRVESRPGRGTTVTVVLPRGE